MLPLNTILLKLNWKESKVSNFVLQIQSLPCYQLHHTPIKFGKDRRTWTLNFGFGIHYVTINTISPLLFGQSRRTRTFTTPPQTVHAAIKHHTLIIWQECRVSNPNYEIQSLVCYQLHHTPKNLVRAVGFEPTGDFTPLRSKRRPLPSYGSILWKFWQGRKDLNSH